MQEAAEPRDRDADADDRDDRVRQPPGRTPLRGRAIASATTAPTIAPPAWSPDQKRSTSHGLCAKMNQ
jgi:hypothetical protein